MDLPRGIEGVSDSDNITGGPVYYLRNNRQRMIDGLREDDWLTSDQYLIASVLRDLWEAGRVVSHVQAADMEISGAAYTSSDQINRFFRKPRQSYERLLSYLDNEQRRTINAVVIHDEHPNTYGARRKCNGLNYLQGCLDKLARYFA